MLSQSVTLTIGTTYRIAYRLTVTGSVVVTVGSDYTHTVTTGTSTVIDTFVASATGTVTLSFTEQIDATSIIVEAVSFKTASAAVVSNQVAKEFLTGSTDDGREIFFQADTQTLQIQAGPEMYSSPIAVATETERGSMLKVYVSLDDKSFYELEGTVVKGVSVLKFNTQTPKTPKPPPAQSIQVSYRDGSKQRCRILQAAVVTIPTPIDFAQ